MGELQAGVLLRGKTGRAVSAGKSLRSLGLLQNKKRDEGPRDRSRSQTEKEREVVSPGFIGVESKFIARPVYTNLYPFRNQKPLGVGTAQAR